MLAIADDNCSHRERSPNRLPPTDRGEMIDARPLFVVRDGPLRAHPPLPLAGTTANSDALAIDASGRLAVP